MSNVLKSVASKLTKKKSAAVSINLPGIKLEVSGTLLDIIPEAGRTVKELANKIDTAVGKVDQILGAATCLGDILTDPSAWMGMLGTMAATAVGVAKNIANRFTKMIKGQITNALSQVSESVNKVVSSIKNLNKKIADFVDSLEATFDALKNFSLNIKIDAEAEAKEFKDQEDCEFMFAAMAACLFNKLGGNKLLDFEKKVSQKIDNLGADISDAISDSLSGVDNIANFLDQQSFMVEKANKQIKGISSLINSAGDKQKTISISLSDKAKSSASNLPLNESSGKSASVTGTTLAEIKKSFENKNK